MQKDFHLAITYVLSRLAGFSKNEADIIAGSSQYVDDAIHSGTIYFNNRAAYEFISSAHKMLDYRNFKELANHKVWIPFHFIPGNQFDNSISDKTPEFIQKLICRPNSLIANEIVNQCAKNHELPFSLHLFGIAMHAYADTWAHQGFAGITHEVNQVEDIYDGEGNFDTEMIDRRDKFFKRGRHTPCWKRLLRYIASDLANEFNPVGHGPVLSYPDLPYLVWSYKDYLGRVITRNNPKDYLEAVDNVFLMLSNFFKLKYPERPSSVFKQKDREAIIALIEGNTSFEADERIKCWWDAIQQNTFSFGTDICDYQESGLDSWLFKALGILDVESEESFHNISFNPNFMQSEWKNLHDALVFFRFHILNVILPKHNLCVV